MTNAELADTILTEQYKLAGLTIEQAKAMKNEEFNNFRLTPDIHLKWYVWAVQFVKQHRKSWPADKCKKEVGMLDFQHGLNIQYD
jgi:hypothetical protein